MSRRRQISPSISPIFGLYISSNAKIFIEVENDFSEDIIIEKESGLPVISKESGKLHEIGISKGVQRNIKAILILKFLIQTAGKNSVLQ